VTHFQTICLLFLSPNFDLHSGDEIAAYTQFYLHLLLDQPPYYSAEDVTVFMTVRHSSLCLLTVGPCYEEVGRCGVCAVCLVAGRRHVGPLLGPSVQTHQHREQGAVRAHESHCHNAQFQVTYDPLHCSRPWESCNLSDMHVGKFPDFLVGGWYFARRGATVGERGVIPLNSTLVQHQKHALCTSSE
jgi:hypothetical protein